MEQGCGRVRPPARGSRAPGLACGPDPSTPHAQCWPGAAAQVARRCPLGPSGEPLPLWLGQRLALSDVGDPRAGTVASSRRPTSWCECGRLMSHCAERGCTLARAGPALRSAAPSLRAHTRLSRSPSRSRAPGAERPGDPWPPILTPALEPCPRTPSPPRRLKLDTFWLVLGLHPSCSPCLFLREQFCSHFSLLISLAVSCPRPPSGAPSQCERPLHLSKPGVLGQPACSLTPAASRGRKQGRGSAAWGLR